MEIEERMSIESDRLKHEQAKEQGRAARRNGRKKDTCPYRQGTCDDQRIAWMEGFTEVDMERRAR